VRILHLIDPASPGGGPGTLRLIAEALPRTTGAVHDLLIVGNSRHLAMARRCGLDPRGRITAPLNRPALARGGLQAYLASWEPVHGQYDLLHAWTLPAARLGRFGLGRRAMLATALLPPPPERGGIAARVLAPLRGRPMPVLAGTAHIRRTLEAAGWDPDLITLMPPAVDGDAIGPEQRTLLRQGWGADETTFVVALLGEPSAWADGKLAINAVGRVVLTGKDVRLILDHRTASTDDLRSWLGRLGVDQFVVIDDAVAEPWRVVAGIDAALVASRHGARPAEPAVSSMLWVMAAGVPVIAQAVDSCAGIIEDGATGLLCKPGSYNHAAACILRLYDDAREAKRIGESARTKVERSFAIADFAARLDTVYAQCARGEPIRLADPAARTPEPNKRARTPVARTASPR
jgi:glycosyltransferase involved in cell wall biosynthesis